MKKSTILVLAVIAFACQNHKNGRLVKTDTIGPLILRGQNDLDPQHWRAFITAVVDITESRKPSKDSTSDRLEWGYDTTIKRYLAVDTARGADFKPVYDSVKKRYRMDTTWQDMFKYDVNSAKLMR